MLCLYLLPLMNPRPDKLHRRSIRLQDYDYVQAGAYCVTICTQNRECTFGNIVSGKIALSAIGTIVEKCWREIPAHFPHVSLDAFVVMPNHIHGILLIAKGRGTACRAPTLERFGKPVADSVPTIVRSLKSAVTKQINAVRRSQSVSIWQRNYYERVIRSEEELHRIRQYIVNNPLRWALDRENPAVVRPSLLPGGSQTHPSMGIKGSQVIPFDDLETIFEVRPA